MPEEPPNKKLKQTEPQSPAGEKKQTARDDKSGETSHNAQERMDSTTSETGRVIKEEKPSKSDHAPQLNAAGKTHTFQFCIRNGEKNKVVCDASKTIFGALNENNDFQNEDKEGKEIIIRRSKEQNHEAAVKTNFPCCLIEEDETLQINFFKDKNSASTNQETTADTDPKSLVTFYIRTRGTTKKKIMKSSIFSENTIDYVCVFAHKGDIIEKALQHDGRFSDDIFLKVCKLVDDTKINHSIKLTVDQCDGKKFVLNVTSKKPQAPVGSDKNVGESVKHSKQPKNTKQKTIQEKKTRPAGPSTEGDATQNTSGNSSGYSAYSCSTEIKDILQTQCKVLFEMLQNPQNPQIQELYQEEFDKSLQSFTDVKNVKWLMELSNSVCLIKVENSARGTGFLLFDRFILTNAHVVKDFVYPSPEAPHTLKLSRKFMALFNYEVMESGNFLKVKDDVVAYGLGNDESHDFALLELEAAPDNCTELLERCTHAPSPNSGGIYIVGHPDCGVKKMDPCFIIGIENRQQSINKHISENVSCPYASWQCWSGLRQNHITYDSCFFHGSSGSPVFDEHCYLIGMHTGGFHYKNAYTGRSVIEYSVSIQSIIKKIHTQIKTRSDVFDLFSKFEYVKNITSEADMPVRQENLSEEVERMNLN